MDNSEDIIDSRQVNERIDELENELREAHEAEGNGGEFSTWVANADADSAHTLQDAATEYLALMAFRDEAQGYCSDWHHGETLIRDSYFRDYAEELADDIGAISKDATWPNNHIDWDAAARELRQDYTSAEFAGVTYWFRS